MEDSPLRGFEYSYRAADYRRARQAVKAFAQKKFPRVAPDCAALHPGYAVRRQLERLERLKQLERVFLLATHRRLVNLMDRRAAAAALRRAAAGKVDEPLDKSHAGHAVHGDRHIFQMMPSIRDGIVVVMVRINSVGMLGVAFAAE